MSYYLFVVNDVDYGNEILTAEEITHTLLANKIWAYTKSTFHLKKFTRGDNVLLYCAGRKRRYFIAKFTIVGAIESNAIEPKGKNEEILKKTFPLQSKIDDVKIWSNPMPIKDIIEELDFITDKKNWGLWFRKSVLALNKDAFDLILKRMQNHANEQKIPKR